MGRSQKTIARVKYQTKIIDKTLKKLEKLPKKDKERIIEAIDSLIEDPRPDGCEKLKGNRTPLHYRIRAGNYRVVYSIQDEMLLIPFLVLSIHGTYSPEELKKRLGLDV